MNQELKFEKGASVLEFCERNDKIAVLVGTAAGSSAVQYNYGFTLTQYETRELHSWLGVLLNGDPKNQRLCTGCNKCLPFDRFKNAEADFPTRDGYVYKCFDCVGPYRLVRDPVTNKVEFIK